VILQLLGHLGCQGARDLQDEGSTGVTWGGWGGRLPAPPAAGRHVGGRTGGWGRLAGGLTQALTSGLEAILILHTRPSVQHLMMSYSNRLISCRQQAGSR
jgi:hypothetical protein